MRRWQATVSTLGTRGRRPAGGCIGADRGGLYLSGLAVIGTRSVETRNLLGLTCCTATAAGLESGFPRACEILAP